MQKINYKKIIQVINFFAKKEEGKIDKLKLLKLIWLADRYHLRKYGRSITNDQYWAMSFGPVASNTKDLINKNILDETEKKYRDRYLKILGNKIESIERCNLDFFSKSDIEAMKEIYETYGKYKNSKLVDLSHEFPEWKKHKNWLENNNNTRELMSYDDFFLNPEKEIKNFPNIFQEDKKGLTSSKKFFQMFYKDDKCWI